MRAKAWLAFCLVTLLDVAVACMGPTNDLSHAAALPGCGPTDGPATIILLSEAPIVGTQAQPPVVQIMLEAPVTALAGRSWDVDLETGWAAVYRPSKDAYEPALHGRVSVSQVDSANNVDGSVDLTYPSRRVVTDFSAPWKSSAVLCG